jgi:hypothetical protein
VRNRRDDYGVGEADTEAQRRPDTEAADRVVDEAMTRSEEELRVGTETRERGRVRLRST